jgi:hypothetical protein
LALEQLHLNIEAEKAWENVIYRDAGSPWATEAAIHVKALGATR